MQIRVPPSNASIATTPDPSGKLHAPSAARNAADLCETVKSIAPLTGHALEIASGTGQHIIAFADAMAGIHWHPSEVERDRQKSIKTYTLESGLSNIAAPITLNATQSGWCDTIEPKDLILTANLLHLISEPEVTTLLNEAARALLQTGQLCLYGPFKREGQLTSEGDANFDASLRASDPDIGYKDDAWIKAVASQAGLVCERSVEMPANNLILVFRKY